MSFLGLPLRHIPPLFIGTSITCACIPTYFNTPFGMRLYGLPDHIATSSSAQSPFLLYTSRIHAIGMMVLVFYARGDYAAVDTVMSFLGFLGAMDVWVCVREGVKKKAVERGLTSLVVAAWGLAGMTSASL
ncbi:hypothetical protein GQ44DRAFT_604351 [Phaeosphaeriaceae sp. PMI808]|nr:hypothetical protein GQ44DRAFT_604351 [Phaeosphaeriaceae sp. PMI808]